MSGMRKPPPEPSVPSENLTGEVGGINCGGGHGSPPVLSEVPHELSTAAHSKECKRSPQQFIPAGFPLTTTYNPGTEGSASPPHHTEHGPFRTRPPFSTKIHHINPSHKEFLFQFIILRKLRRRHNREPLFHILSCRITLPAENFKV